MGGNALPPLPPHALASPAFARLCKMNDRFMME